jgi:hypothetical protein
MKTTGFAALLLCFASIAAALPPATMPEKSTLAKAPTWQQPSAGEVKTRTLAWLDTTKPIAAVRAKADTLWAGVGSQAAGSALLTAACETFALANADAAHLVELCKAVKSGSRLPIETWLRDPKTPPWLAANLRLLYGRWLVQNALFEEAQEQLADLKPADVAAPAELLFFQGVVYYRMLNREAGLKVLDQLLDGADTSPRRYVAVARLMQSDLSGMEPDTLDHVARRMEDIQRRLDLGRAGPKVRNVEKGVIDTLDKLIQKAEEEEQKQQQSASNRSSRPAQQSRLMGGGGPGEVTKRNIGSKSGWGDLPPKEREEALQQVGREFPPDCRDIIEQYFRRLATEENRENK